MSILLTNKNSEVCIYLKYTFPLQLIAYQVCTCAPHCAREDVKMQVATLHGPLPTFGEDQCRNDGTKVNSPLCIIPSSQPRLGLRRILQTIFRARQEGERLPPSAF